MIAIIGAMDVEVEAIKKYMTDIEELILNKTLFLKGLINDKEVILTKCGVGKVNSAITTTTLLNNFDVEYVVNIGVAGGMDENFEILDVVVSKDLIQHDYDTSYLDGDEGLGLKFEGDRELSKKVMAAFESIDEDIKVHYGDIISGDIFVGEDNEILKIKNKFPSAYACEMEGAAIAQVCDRLEVPCIGVRALSDIVMKNYEYDEFWKNVDIASERSALMIYKLLS